MYNFVSPRLNYSNFFLFLYSINFVSRRDVVYFGVDEYDEPELTYYNCKVREAAKKIKIFFF